MGSKVSTGEGLPDGEVELLELVDEFEEEEVEDREEGEDAHNGAAYQIQDDEDNQTQEEIF